MLNKKMHTPKDVDYNFSDKIELDLAPRRQIRPDGSPNYATALYEAPEPPPAIRTSNNRLTVAMDVGFWGNFLSHHHLIMAARLRTHHYINDGDNRCGAAAVGSWTAQHGFPEVRRGAAIEEPEITNDFKNQFHHLRSNCLTEGKRYRLILDSIFHNGIMANEMRIKDHTTGLIIYSTTGTAFSSFTHNYNPQSRLIMIATLAAAGSPVGGSFSNLVSYWTLSSEWIPDP